MHTSSVSRSGEVLTDVAARSDALGYFSFYGSGAAPNCLKEQFFVHDYSDLVRDSLPATVHPLYVLVHPLCVTVTRFI